MASSKWKPVFYTCSVCGHAVSEGAVNAHLAKCQPNGTKCGVCGDIITQYDFIGHYQECVLRNNISMLSGGL